MLSLYTLHCLLLCLEGNYNWFVCFGIFTGRNCQLKIWSTGRSLCSLFEFTPIELRHAPLSQRTDTERIMSWLQSTTLLVCLFLVLCFTVWYGNEGQRYTSRLRWEYSKGGGGRINGPPGTAGFRKLRYSLLGPVVPLRLASRWFPATPETKRKRN